MALMSYRNDPFDRLFDGLMGGGTTGGAMMSAPPTDVLETEREIQVHVEMPGLKRDNIDIDIENNVLTIRGEKRAERKEGQPGRFHMAERRYGTFARSFVLPRDVNAERIEARFEDGVLTVSIPKSERARRRRIEVGGAGGDGATGGGSQVGGSRGEGMQGGASGQGGMAGQGGARSPDAEATE